MLPISTVDKPGFKDLLIPNTDCQVVIILLKSVSQSWYLKQKGITAKETAVGNVEYFSDLCNTAAGDPYITFTCHFIDQHWEMKSYCFQHITCSNTTLTPTLKCFN